MIRNILYSLFIHSILIILIYFSFNPTPPIMEIDKTLKVAVSFVTKAGNSSSNVLPQQPPMPPIPNEMPKPLPPEIKPKEIISPIEREKPKPKPKKSPPKPKKIEKSQKNQTKQEAKKSKPKEIDAKSDANKVKLPNKKDDAKQEPEKPKFEEKKPEIKEEIKKDKPKEVVPEKEKLEKEKIEKEKVEVAKPEEEDDQDDSEENEESQYSFTENSIESLDLLGREKFNIQTQIKRCYKKALQESGKDSQMVTNAHIFIAQDGFIDLDVVVFKIPPEKFKNGVEDPDFTKAKEIVKKALKFCSPLRNLPQDKYDIWKEIDLQFD